MKNRFQPLFNAAGADGSDNGGDGGATGATGSTGSAPPASAFNSDGTFGDNWHSGLGDEFAPHGDALKPFKDVKSLAKSYLHFRSNGPAYPGDGATDDDISRFRSMAKVPQEGTAAAYGLKIPDGADDATKARYEDAAKWAHELHIPAPAFAKLVEKWDAKQAAEVQQWESDIAATRKAAEDELVGLWKGNFEANKSTVRHLTAKFAEAAGISADDPTVAEMANNPAFARIMMEIARNTSEDAIRPPGGMGDLRSPQQRADAIMDGTDPVWGKKYTEGTQEEQVAAYNEVSRLLNMASK